jgi:hypothetical protein
MRLFFEVVQLNPRDPIATPIVARMELFAVDAEAPSTHRCCTCDSGRMSFQLVPGGYRCLVLRGGDVLGRRGRASRSSRVKF